MLVSCKREAGRRHLLSLSGVYCVWELGSLGRAVTDLVRVNVPRESGYTVHGSYAEDINERHNVTGC